MSDVMNYPPIDLSPAELQSRLSRPDTLLIDVREPFEHHAERIDGAVHMPLGSLDVQAIDQQYPDKQVIFHCAGGKRSAKACAVWSASKGESAAHLAGGIEAWKQAGLATIKPKTGGVSVMRQVHITAGSLVLVGLLLGAFVAKPFLLLSAFVGAGLVFSGVSGWCGMAKLLGVMPWNRPA